MSLQAFCSNQQGTISEWNSAHPDRKLHGPTYLTFDFGRDGGTNMGAIKVRSKPISMNHNDI